MPKIYYVTVGEGAVPGEIRQAARWAVETARQELRMRSPVFLAWIEEFDPEKDSYFSRYPQDLEDPDFGVIQRDERVSGLAIPNRNAVFLNVALREPLDVIEVAVHEVAHCIQPAEMSPEQREHDSKAVSALFIAGFFGLVKARRIA